MQYWQSSSYSVSASSDGDCSDSDGTRSNDADLGMEVDAYDHDSVWLTLASEILLSTVLASGTRATQPVLEGAQKDISCR